MSTNRVERRLAAMLAAGVVGYSRMVAADEAGALAALRAARAELLDPAIDGHGGRIVKTIKDNTDDGESVLEPCRAGLFAERYVANKHCVTCNAEKTRLRERQRGLPVRLSSLLVHAL